MTMQSTKIPPARVRRRSHVVYSNKRRGDLSATDVGSADHVGTGWKHDPIDLTCPITTVAKCDTTPQLQEPASVQSVSSNAVPRRWRVTQGHTAETAPERLNESLSRLDVVPASERIRHDLCVLIDLVREAVASEVRLRLSSLHDPSTWLSNSHTVPGDQYMGPAPSAQQSEQQPHPQYLESPKSQLSLPSIRELGLDLPSQDFDAKIDRLPSITVTAAEWSDHDSLFDEVDETAQTLDLALCDSTLGGFENITGHGDNPSQQSSEACAQPDHVASRFDVRNKDFWTKQRQ